MNDKLLHVGLDVGSTTVKIIVMNSNEETIYEDYRRHFSDTKIQYVKCFQNLPKSTQITHSH